MEKRIYNEQTGISYTLQGDYYLNILPNPHKTKEQASKPAPYITKKLEIAKKSSVHNSNPL